MAIGVIEYLERQSYDGGRRDIPMNALHDQVRVILEAAKQGNFNEADEMAEAFCFSLGAYLWRGVATFQQQHLCATRDVAIKAEVLLPQSGNVIPFRARAH